ncbi:uncharacterized protein TNCV_1506261 [Trichonephila clavipes]|nr:uncharacterized protein TNCV_1506261 [Trichonephila clavipes]
MVIFEHIPYENLAILVEFTLCCPGTNAVVERVFVIDNDFWTSEKSRLNVDTLAAALTVEEGACRLGKIHTVISTSGITEDFVLFQRIRVTVKNSRPTQATPVDRGLYEEWGD